MKSLPGRTDCKCKGPAVGGRGREVRCLDRVAQRCGGRVWSGPRGDAARPRRPPRRRGACRKAANSRLVGSPELPVASPSVVPTGLWTSLGELCPLHHLPLLPKQKRAGILTADALATVAPGCGPHGCSSLALNRDLQTGAWEACSLQTQAEPPSVCLSVCLPNPQATVLLCFT